MTLISHFSGGLLLLSLAGAGCITPSEKEKLNSDIFYLKTRLLTMEGKLKGQNSQTTVQGQTLANSHSRLDKLEFSLQKVQGDVDTLKVGVRTGQLPGANQDEESVAKSIILLNSQLEKIAAKQQALQTEIKKISQKKQRAKSRKDKAPAKKLSLGGLQKAFSKKRYVFVAKEAPEYLKKAKKSEKSDVMFLHAESLYKLGRIKDAALKYNDFISLGDKARLPYAKMRMGDCFRHLGESSTAKLYYEELLSQFPSTAEAQKAKERLRKL